jgi:uncharacterized protein (DUF1697 family)
MGRAAGTPAGGAHTDAQYRFVALLRGVNVGGRTLPMQQLRDLVTSLGHTDVATYIQSGNVLFGSGRGDRDAIAGEIRAAIKATVGHEVTVVLRTPAELERVIAANPFADRGETRSLHVTFLADPPAAETLERLDAAERVADEYHVTDLEIYVWCLTGYGRTVLTNEFFERRLKVAATTRNWRTVTTLAQMARR